MKKHKFKNDYLPFILACAILINAALQLQISDEGVFITLCTFKSGLSFLCMVKDSFIKNTTIFPCSCKEKSLKTHRKAELLCRGKGCCIHSLYLYPSHTHTHRHLFLKKPGPSLCCSYQNDVSYTVCVP